MSEKQEFLTRDDLLREISLRMAVQSVTNDHGDPNNANEFIVKRARAFNDFMQSGDMRSGEKSAE